MRWALVFLVFASGCAPWMWNRKFVDCTDFNELFIEASDIDVVSGMPDGDDPCTLGLKGLRESSLDRGGKKMWIYETGRVLLLQNKDRPKTNLIWTFSAAVDIDRDDFLLELDTDRGRTSGHVTYQDADDLLVVNLREGTLDDLEIETQGDVELHLPLEGAYRFDIQSYRIEWNDFVVDADGVRVFVDTPGYVFIKEPIEKLPRN